MLTPEEQKYLDAINARASLGEVESLDSVGNEGDGESMQALAMKQQQDQAQLNELSKNSQAAGGELQKAGGAVTTGGAIGGNPYVAGAGLALSTIGQVDSAKRASEQAKIDAYNRKIMAQRSAIRNFFE